MTRFRPCIDLHAGVVKQIVGGTLSAASPDQLTTNHVSTQSAAHFAALYRQSELEGGHVIQLGPGNEAAAEEALAAWPGGLQIGGGITAANARLWIERGASKVIVTSFLFPDAKFSMSRLEEMLEALSGKKELLVLDLSCRRQGDGWVVAMDKWQTLTDMAVTEATIHTLEPHCSEFLIHAADHEGLQAGIDEALVTQLSRWCRIPVTYAGGARSLADLERVRELSGGRVDLTIGSALDVFGGRGARLEECVAWNARCG